MMKAYHIMGLTARELGGFLSYGAAAAPVVAAVRARWEQVIAAGQLQPRGVLRNAGIDIDRSTEEDDLAGDDCFVFLSVGARYATGDLAPVAFGFVFDAEELLAAGALLGKYDLASDYGAIVGAVAEEVAATLPRRPEISAEELAEFAELMGEDDPELLEAVRGGSTDPEYDLITAIHAQERTFPGCAQALALIAERIGVLHSQTRLSGPAALAYLRSQPADGRMELLWPGPLPLSLARGRVEPGRPVCTG